MDLEATEKAAEQFKRQAAEEIDRARTAKGITEDVRRQRIAAAQQKCSDQLTQLLVELMESAEAERAALERKLWANTRPEDAVGFRDAMDRVRAITDEGEAKELFAVVVKSGDSQLAVPLLCPPGWAPLRTPTKTRTRSGGATLKPCANTTVLERRVQDEAEHAHHGTVRARALRGPGPRTAPVGRGRRRLTPTTAGEPHVLAW